MATVAGVPADPRWDRAPLDRRRPERVGPSAWVPGEQYGGYRWGSNGQGRGGGSRRRTGAAGATLAARTTVAQGDPSPHRQTAGGVDRRGGGDADGATRGAVGGGSAVAPERGQGGEHRRLLDDPQLDPERVLPLLQADLLPTRLAEVVEAHAVSAAQAERRHARWHPLTVIVDETTVRDQVHVLAAGRAYQGIAVPLGFPAEHGSAGVPPWPYAPGPRTRPLPPASTGASCTRSSPTCRRPCRRCSANTWCWPPTAAMASRG